MDLVGDGRFLFEGSPSIRPDTLRATTKNLIQNSQKNQGTNSAAVWLTHFDQIPEVIMSFLRENARSSH
jgi:hypothetical protein